MKQEKLWIIFLTLIAVALCALIIHQLYSYHRFLSDRDERYHLAVKQLVAIREAQIAYKQKHGKYLQNLDSLNKFYDSIQKSNGNYLTVNNLTNFRIEGKPVKISVKIKVLQQDSKNFQSDYALKISIPKIDVLRGLPENYISQELSNQSPIPGKEIFFGSETNSSLAGNWNASYEKTTPQKISP